MVEEVLDKKQEKNTGESEYESEPLDPDIPGIRAGCLLRSRRGSLRSADLAPRARQLVHRLQPESLLVPVARAGFVALGLLWVSMMLGVGITNKLARLWPGIPPAMAIHEYTSLLGLFFAGFHALILLGDQYSQYKLVQLLMPFGSVQYRPTWVGLGQLGFYAWFIIAVTFYIRKAIGKKTWRVIHYASFVCYLVAVIHGLVSGTDTAAIWAQDFYWITGGSLLFLLVYRILTSGKTVRNPAAIQGPVLVPVRESPPR